MHRVHVITNKVLQQTITVDLLNATPWDWKHG